jgi:hypothetical protein
MRPVAALHAPATFLKFVWLELTGGGSHPRFRQTQNRKSRIPLAGY